MLMFLSFAFFIHVFWFLFFSDIISRCSEKKKIIVQGFQIASNSQWSTFFFFFLSPTWPLRDKVVDLSKLRLRVYPSARQHDTKLIKNDNTTPLYQQTQAEENHQG